MAEYYNVTTNLGDAEIANAIATNTKLNITHIAFGDGNGSVPTPTKTRTSLVREVHRQAVTKYERHATNANWIVIETIIPSDIGGFTIREMGIIANGKLISHGSHAPFEKLADPSGVSEYRLKFTQNITDGNVVSLILDESLIYATQAWVDENYIKRSEIVDNLTTNEPAKPVSAKQAKVLQDTKLGKTENAASATKLQTARTIGGVSFDGSENINLPGVNTAGNQSTTGNAATATSAAKWTTARTLTIGDSGKSVDGGGNVSWSRLDMGVPWTTTTTSVGIDNAESCIGYVSNTLLGASDGALYSHVYSEIWKHQIQGDYRTGQIALRGKNNGTWQAWRTVLDSGNYNNYSPTKTGTGASGSWGISITGNAASATDCSRSVIAGNGLSGGGTLEANRTLTLGTPSKITGSTTNSVTATSHTHEIDNASISVAGVVKLNNTLTSTSTSEAATANTVKLLNDKAFGVGQTWNNVTASRVLGTTYTNTTEKTIFVSFQVRDHSDQSNQVVNIYVDAIKIIDSAAFDGGAVWGCFSHSFPVPPGGTYSIQRTGNGTWIWMEFK